MKLFSNNGAVKHGRSARPSVWRQGNSTYEGALVSRCRSEDVPWHEPQPGPLTLGVLLLGYAAVATAGGWMASRGEQRAPAVAVLALGIALVSLALLFPLPGRAPLPTWYLLGQAVAVLTGAMNGGLHRIATWRLPRPAPDDRRGTVQNETSTPMAGRTGNIEIPDRVGGVRS